MRSPNENRGFSIALRSVPHIIGNGCFLILLWCWFTYREKSVRHAMHEQLPGPKIVLMLFPAILLVYRLIGIAVDTVAGK